MNKRRYRPGAKDPRHRDVHSGKMSPGRYAWLRTIAGQMQILRYSESPHEEAGQTIVLFVPRKNARPFTINMTGLTAQELDLTRQFFNELFDLAEPICRERDKVAQDAFESGDDSYTRCYRQVPQLVIREGAVAPHPEGVLGGPEDVPLGFEEGDGLQGGVREPGDGLADGQPQDSGTEDDEPKADQP